MLTGKARAQNRHSSKSKPLAHVNTLLIVVYQRRLQGCLTNKEIIIIIITKFGNIFLSAKSHLPENS